MISLNSKKFSIIQIVLFSAIFSLITCGGVYYWLKKQNEEALVSNSSKYCDYNIKRIKGLKFVKQVPNGKLLRLLKNTNNLMD